MDSMVRIFNTACNQWWLPGHGSGMTENIKEAWVLPLEQAKSLTYGATVLNVEPINAAPPVPDELTTARAEAAMLRDGVARVLRGPISNSLVRIELERFLSTPASDWLAKRDAEKDAEIAAAKEEAAARLKQFLTQVKMDNAAIKEWEIDRDQWKARAEKAEAELSDETKRREALERRVNELIPLVQKAEAERDGLAEAVGYFTTSDPETSVHLARIAAEARRRALLDVAEAALEKYGASPTQHWLARLAQEADHA